MRKVVVLTVCAVLLWTVSAFAEPPAYLAGVTWTAVGPGGGGAEYNPVMAPGNTNLMYGFADMGGIYRSADGGHNWTMLRPDQAQFPTTYHPYHCNPAFDPNDGNTCYIGIYDGLKRTTDGGLTWAYLASGSAVQAVAIDRSATNVVFYADAANRIFRSSNAGSTWTECATWRTGVNKTVMDLFIDASSSSSSPTVYAATETGLYKTTDGGATWNAANGNLPSTSVSDFNAAMKAGAAQLYVAIWDQGIFKSTNGGVTWTAKNTGFNVAEAGHMELGICDGNADILYVGSGEYWGGPAIYKTVDGGDNWTLQLIHPYCAYFPTSVTLERSWMWSSRPPFDWGWQGEPHEIGVCPTDGNVAAFADDGLTWRTDDGGQSWWCPNTHETSVGSDWWTSTGFETTTNYFVRFAPWDHNRAYIAYTDIGFFRSEDRGYSWRVACLGSPWKNTFYDFAFDPTVPGKMWAVASNHHDLPHDKMLRRSDISTFTGGVVISTDYGANWTDLGHATGLSVGAPTSIVVDPTSPESGRTIYVTVMAHGVYKSTDGGATWAAANNGLGDANNMNAWMIKRMPDGALYCATTMAWSGGARYPGGLFKSTDGAALWTKINNSQVLPYINGFDVDPSDQNRIYVATFGMGYDGSQGLYVTTDGGTTWTRTLDLADTCGASIDPSNHARVYTTLEQGEDFWPNGGVYLSEGYGATWTKIPNFPFERFGPNWICFDPDDSTQIYVTSFGGGVWKATIPQLPQPLSVATTSLPDGLTLSPYSQTLAATGGVTPYAWSLNGGGLPAGLSLNASTGVISGTPATAGTSSFTVRVTDSQGTPATAEQPLSITIVDSGAAYHFTASDSEASTTSITYIAKAALTFNPPAADDWIIFGFAEFRSPSASYATYVQLFVDGAGEGQNTRKPVSVTDYMPFVTVKVKNLAPGPHTINLMWRASNISVPAYVRNARICAVRKAALEFYNVARDGGVPLTQTLADITSLTWTPATTGAYLVISTGEVNATTTVSTRVQTIYNGTVNDEGIIRAADNGDFTTFMSFNYINAAAGAPVVHKIAASKMGPDPINHYIRRARILSLRLTDGRFRAAASQFALEQNTTSTTFQQCLTYTWTHGLNGNWLFLNGARLNNSSTSYQTEVRAQFNDAGICGQQLMRPRHSTDLLNFSSIDVRNVTSPRKMDMDWRTTNVAGTAKVKRLRFYGLPLGAQ